MSKKKKNKPKRGHTLEFDTIEELFPAMGDGDDLDVVYYEGYAAFELEVDSKQLSVCPYAMDGPERIEWLCGYRSARSDMEKQVEKK